MSRENVEIVRAAWDAWNRGDWDEWRSYLSADFELDDSSALGEWRGVTRGPDQVLREIQQFLEPWKSVRIEIDELIDAGEHVVQRGTLTSWAGTGLRCRPKALIAGRLETES